MVATYGQSKDATKGGLKMSNVIPRVKVVSGSNGSNLRIFIDGQELKSASDVQVHLERGSMAEVTVKLTAVIVNEESLFPKDKPKNEITVKVNVDTRETKERIDELVSSIQRLKAMGKL